MPATVGGIRAGRAFILIEAVDATGKVLNAIGSKFKSWGRSLMMTGMDMAFKAAMNLTGVGAATSVFSKFDDAMRRVEARSEGTGDQLRMLREEARLLGKTTALSAIDVANLAAELAAMGFTRSQMLQMVRPITMLAQAGGTGNKALDAVNSAKLVSGTLRSFQMDFSEAGHVADIMAQALNLSNAALEDMATSMAYAGPIANRYNVSLEDTVSVLGHLRNLNIDAETAGTAFRNMLLEMTDPKGRDKFNKLLDEMTGKTINFIDEAGNLKSVTDLLFAIGEVSKGLGTAQQGQLFFELFGKRAIVPASALAEGRNAFEAIRMQMDDVNGVATKMANIMESGLGGSWRRLTGAVIDTSIAIGETLAPMLQDLSLKFRVVLNSVTGFVTRNRGLINSVVTAVAVWGTLGVTLIAAGLALRLVAFGLSGIVPVVTILAFAVRTLSLSITLLFTTARVLIATTVLLTGVFRGLLITITSFTFVINLTRGLILLSNAATVAYGASLVALRSIIRFLAAEMVIWQSIGQALIGVTRLLYAMSQGARVTGIAFATTGTMIRTSQTATNALIMSSYGMLSVLRSTQIGFLATSRVIWASVTAIRALVTATTVTGPILALSTTLTLVLNPLVLIIGALSALAYFNRQRIFDASANSAMFFKRAILDLSQDFMSWFSRMKTSAIDLGSTVSKTFTGLSEALAMGDTTAAWEITLNGLQTAWLQFKDMLMDTWGDFVRFFQEAWAGAIGFYSLQLERLRTIGIDKFGGGPGGKAMEFDEETGKFIIYDTINREEYLARYRLRLEEQTAKEISDIRAKYAEDDERRAIEIGKSKEELEKKLAEIRDKAALAASEELKRQIEDTKAEMAALTLATLGGVGTTPEGIIGIGAGAAGLAPEIGESLQRGSVEAAKQAYESFVKSSTMGEDTIAKATLEATKASKESLGRIDKHIELIDEKLAALTTA